MPRRAQFLAPLAMLMLAGLSAPLARCAAQEFEGVITMRLSRGAQDGRVTTMDAQYMTRKGDVRVEVGAGTPNSLAGIILPREKKMYRLMSAQSLYSEQPLPEVPASTGTSTPKVVRTGRKESIAGYECEHIAVMVATDTTDVCMAKGLGTFATVAAALGAVTTRVDAWQRTLMSEGAFPLRVTQRGATMMEVTKIEKKFLSDALFIVPDSYSRAPSPPPRKPL